MYRLKPGNDPQPRLVATTDALTDRPTVSSKVPTCDIICKEFQFHPLAYIISKLITAALPVGTVSFHFHPVHYSWYWLSFRW
jgi:hypothetical protein